MTLDFTAILARWQMLADGLMLTIQLAAVTTLTGFLIGTFCAIARRSDVVFLKRIAAFYVEAIRNTPFLVQIFVVYFGLSSLGFSFSAVTVAIIALTINVGAYTAEIMRAGFDSIHRGQWEAGECLGLSRAQTYWHVALRPAMERMYPSLTSQFILLMLASSVTSQISAEELTAAANFIQSETYRPFETYIVVALIYLALSLVMRLIFWAFGLLVFPRLRRLGTSL
ncbi:amino acid ABC transporter permease [Mesorhizobium sp. SB112]|uniref:amino acid ABC transporter permease n=1 Tax=Mesorhizobium sp. SB112 TaxID=3151853 RepID=UPI003264EE05